MRLNQIFGWLACALLVAGCSTVRTSVDKPVRGATYSLVASKAPPRDVVNKRREEVHNIIQHALAVELERKGLKQVDQGGDVQVAYMIIVVDNVSTATDADYYGYGPDSEALAKKAHKERGRVSSRDYFEVGTIVIDVINPRDGKVLFRSTAQMDVRNATPTNSGDRIQGLVADCLEGLRVNK